MTIKPGVTIGKIQDQLIFGLILAEGVYQRFGLALVITSICEGKHSATSLHPKGLAADLRIPRDPVFTAKNFQAFCVKLHDALGAALGPEWDVVLEDETTPGSTGVHIHIEYDPK